jgi:FkbM family methyltransferase
MLISVQELARDWGVCPDGVIHVGAHLGEEAIHYESENWLPITWIEAQPELAFDLRARLKAPSHNIIEAAVWNENDLKLDLHLASNSQSSSLLEFGTHLIDYPDITFTNKIQVHTKRLDSLISLVDMPNFINLDIQGVEMQALESLGILVQKLDYIFVEVNRKDVYLGCTKVWDLDRFLETKGFKRRITRWYLKQGWGDALYVRGSKSEKRNVLQYTRSTYKQFIFYLRQFGGVIKQSLLNP